MKHHKIKSVKKTLTIPQWLNELAIAKNINFSQTLAEALKKELEEYIEEKKAQ
jgi:antitoxin HicB